MINRSHKLVQKNRHSQFVMSEVGVGTSVEQYVNRKRDDGKNSGD